MLKYAMLIICSLSHFLCDTLTDLIYINYDSSLFCILALKYCFCFLSRFPFVFSSRYVSSTRTCFETKMYSCFLNRFSLRKPGSAPDDDVDDDDDLVFYVIKLKQRRTVKGQGG